MASSSPSNGVRTDLRLLYRGPRHNPGTGHLADPFAVNPIRRSAVMVLVSATIVFGPFVIDPTFGATMMLAVGWLTVSGIVIGLPVLVWSLAEVGWHAVQRRLCPSVEQLDLSARVAHILVRHGYRSIASIDRASDTALLLLSNMDPRGLREVRREISLWKYRRWQDRGFPATGYE